MGLFDRLFKKKSIDNQPSQDAAEIQEVLNTHKQKVCDSTLPNITPAIQKIYEGNSEIADERHKIDQAIIAAYNRSSDPLDQLAVGIAYEREGAKFRQKAIQYLNLYFMNPVPLPTIPHTRNVPYFSPWYLHSTLANLYEKEYQYKEAIEELKKCIEINKEHVNSADYTRIATIILKSDGVDAAIQYLDELKKQPEYSKMQYQVDSHYYEMLQKKAAGYVYKPKRK